MEIAVLKRPQTEQGWLVDELKQQLLQLIHK